MMMTTQKSKLMALLTAVSLVAPMAASAQQGQRQPAPPFAEMAQSLGVSKKAVEACFPAMDRKGDKGKAQAKPARPDAGKIAKCLQAENKGLTKAKVEKVLKQFAPAPQRG